VVRRVAPEGPAAAAGIQHGDGIVAIDGSEVRNLAEFYRALWSRGVAGITVELTVNRQGEQQEIGVKTIDRYRYLKLGTTY
jgi:S1-C subfamily serine protease